jgi:hypothetical protein
MKNTDCRLNSINDFNELGETVLHFVRQDATKIEITMDVEAAKLWAARMDRAIKKFEETKNAKVASR